MLYVVAYLGAIVAANLLVAAFGPSVVVVNAFLFIGLDLTCRDKLHDAWAGRDLWVKMGALIGAGGLISYWLNAAAGQIALASCVAFALASLADAIVYALMSGYEKVKVDPGIWVSRHRFSWLERANASNLAGAAIDSLVFPTLAFGSILPAIVLGQFVSKVAGGFVWSLVLDWRHGRAAQRA